MMAAAWLLIVGVVLLPAVVECISNNSGASPSLELVATGGHEVTADAAADDVVVDVVTKDLSRPLATNSEGYVRVVEAIKSRMYYT